MKETFGAVGHGTANLTRIQFCYSHTAHRLGYQVRPRNRYFRYGLVSIRCCCSAYHLPQGYVTEYHPSYPSSYVVMGRPGQRVARRKQKGARVGFQHRVKKEDSVSWFKQRFDGIVGRVSGFVNFTSNGGMVMLIMELCCVYSNRLT